MKTIFTPLSVLILSMIGTTAFAIPAKIGTTSYRQPDGTTINIRKVGNGELHLTTTEDGIILTQDNDGFYRLARIDDHGFIVSTGVKPQEAASSLDAVTRIEDIDISLIKSTRNISTRDADQWGMGLYRNKYPTTGNPRVPVFLVEFPEVQFSTSYDPVEYFNKLCNGDESGDPENDISIRKYFEDQSQGKFSPQFDIYGPVLLPREMSYYGGNYGQGWDVCAHYMVSHAATILDDEVDFSPYDEDGDGNIDFVYVIYAGFGEHRQGGENSVWPHAGDLQRQADFKKVDDLWFKNYACSNELIDENTPEGICTFAHEYSHIIGLPDLYTVDMFIDPRDFTPGQYSLMDYGVYNNDGLTPPNYSAYERNALKWDEPILFDRPMSVELDQISTGQYGLITTNKPEEFFLVENRQLEGWDKYLPGHGLLIWHIDFQESKFTNNIVNKDPAHLYVDVVRANNETSFAKMSDGFPFPGTTGNTSFTPETTPAMVTWKGVAVDFPITDIIEKDGILYFDVAGGDPHKGDDTGIAGLETDSKGIYTVYNLSGIKLFETTDSMRLQALPKGIYIVNGKKTILPSVRK